MKHLPLLALLPAGVGLVLYACSSDAIRPDSSASAGSAQAGSPGASTGQGGSQPSAGQTNVSGQGGSAGSSEQGGSAGTATTPKDCPTQGTPMVRLSSPSGVPYCIDRTEVTQAQYQAFLDAKKGDLSGQDAFCAQSNFTYEPRVKKSDDESPACPVSYWDPKGTPENAVQCMDICDARMYCRSVGKRLCGRIGGGQQKYDMKTINDPEQSQWYNACSQGGKFAFAYGDKADPSRCEEMGPVGEKPDCHGAEAPYDGILNLSGNLAELEDVDTIGSLFGSTLARAPKGAGPDQSSRCDGFSDASSGIGVSFRCCADL